ncbi:PIG-L deacetylase family protein [Chloroflexota bacterium]
MNIIVFNPHPDDAEVLMGGTIAKYTQKGHDVLIVVVTIPNQKERRMEESEKAAAILGARISVLDVDPYELIFNRKLVEVFDEVIKDFSPDIIYTSWINDSHQDHVNVSKTTIAAARKNNCSLYMYEQALPSGLTPYGFRAQAFVDVSDTIELKIESVLAHQSQVQNFSEQWIQGIKARATYMGFQINVKYAEAFEIVKELKEIQ